VVTFQTAEGKDSILDGFTVRDGKALFGAGILIRNASPTIRNCIVRQNTATGGNSPSGGGIGVTGVQAHPSITCTQFLGNVAGFEGGGLESTYSANPYLRSNLFEGNTAPFGGAIGVHWSGRLDLGWTQLLANQASVDGGGIHAGVPYGNVLVRQTWFKGNKAGSNGGGMWVSGAGLADVINCTFDGNQAAQGGGIAAGFGSMVSVASTLFVQNTTTSGGSAALVDANGSNTSVVNHYNGFFGNTGGDHLGTYGDLGLLFLNPQLNACCPGPGSPAINAGIPDLHFNDPVNDPDGPRNDMGACGGPALLTYGPMN
jgi:predicted outer membrane repeat protein